MEIKKNYLINRFFSRNTIKNLVQNKKDPVFERVSQHYKLENNLSTIQNVYNKLSRSYRNEYFYKNTLLNKRLLGIHSVNTTTALTEIPVGRAKPDFILINGKAVVYEIKTELDNFDRLENQINEYYKAFNHVAILTYEKNIEMAKRKIDEINKPKIKAEDLAKDLLSKIKDNINLEEAFDDWYLGKCRGFHDNVFFETPRQNFFESFFYNTPHEIEEFTENETIISYIKSHIINMRLKIQQEKNK